MSALNYKRKNPVGIPGGDDIFRILHFIPLVYFRNFNTFLPYSFPIPPTSQSPRPFSSLFSAAITLPISQITSRCLNFIKREKKLNQIFLFTHMAQRLALETNIVLGNINLKQFTGK
jgi:hypothetical protein